MEADRPPATLAKDPLNGSTWTIFNYLWNKSMGKVIVVTTLLCALVGISLASIVGYYTVQITKSRKQAAMRIAQYEQGLATLPADPQHVNSANANSEVFFTEPKVMQKLLHRVSEIVDSLNIREQVRGYRIIYDLRPKDFLGTTPDIGMQVDIMLKCDCKQNGFYDILGLKIDPRTLQTTLLRHSLGASVDEYETFYLQKGGEK
ncbi:MAG: hypothetical protein AAB515_00400 [Patescibacteria group bacterium]